MGMAHHAAGTCLAALGRSRDALHRFREAVRLEPDLPDHTASLAAAEAVTGASDELR